MLHVVGKMYSAMRPGETYVKHFAMHLKRAKILQRLLRFLGERRNQKFHLCIVFRNTVTTTSALKQMIAMCVYAVPFGLKHRVSPETCNRIVPMS